MSSVKADWHLADLVMDESDPMDITQFATPIDLGSEEAKLRTELRASLRIENRLYNQGISCELKLREGWSCRTCPHRTEDPDVPLMRVCALSMRQLDIVDELQVVRYGGEEAVLAALADAHGDWAIWEAQDLLAAHGDWAMADAVGV